MSLFTDHDLRATCGEELCGTAETGGVSWMKMYIKEGFVSVMGIVFFYLNIR